MPNFKKYRSGHFFVICVLLMATLLLASACSSNPSEAQLPQEPTGIDATSTTPSLSENEPATAIAAVNIDEAKATALEKAGVNAADTTFIRAKLDKDDGIAVYDITFVSGPTRYKVKINAATGAVMKYEAKSVEKLPAKLPAGIIPVDQAKSIALQDAGINDAVFTQIELDRDDGKYRYEIEFIHQNQEYEYEIDAQTGTVIEHEIHSISN